MSPVQLSKFQERNLVSRLKQKDKDAFISIYDLYVDDIFRFIYFKVGNRDETNDLTSIVFLKTWDYIKNNKLKDGSAVRALLYKIARTSIVDYYRSRQVLVSIDDDDHKIEIVDDNQDIIEQISVNSDLELMRKKMPELKNEYREILILRFVNELSLDEISEITGKTKGNVRVLVFRAVKALRELMEDTKS